MNWRGSRVLVVSGLGIGQILGWGTSVYLPAVMAAPIMAGTGWSLAEIVGGATIGLLVAGFVSPRVSRMIDARGGRPLLAASSMLFALGLSTMALAPSVPVYFAAWIVMGVAMGAGTYDAAFAALGRLYGSDARAPMTTLTLFGGFAGTVCWPLSAYLAATFGWREACFIYAALHILVGLPLHLKFPRGRAVAPQAAKMIADGQAAGSSDERIVLFIFAAILTIAAGVGSIIIVHLLVFLQALNLSPAAAVALGMLFGPAQVGARLIERLFGNHYHPIWTAVAATVLMAIGLPLLGISAATAAVAIIIFASGYGITWVVRGTLPLALIGPERYPRLAGRLAFPSLIAQALAPAAGALVFERYGMTVTVACLTVLTTANVLLVGLLWRKAMGKTVSAR